MQRDSVLDCAFDAIVTMDVAGAVVDMNTAAERLFGYSREQAQGRELAGLIIPEEFRDDHRRALARQPHGQPSRVIGRRLELEALHADGTRFPIELSVSRIETPGGIEFTAWIRDLTERRRTEEALRLSEAQLRQAQKMEAVGRLAGGVAHDFNNVLTAIFGYADLVLDSFGPGDQRRQDVEEIKRAAHRAAGLTRQLLAFSRKQVMQPRQVNLNGIIENLETLLLKLIGQEIVLQIDVEPSLWVVKADPGQIEQVLMNLASNARDAMPDGGRLTIATANEDLQPAVRRRRWSGSSRGASSV
jgi:PAS domain S-box-containing protein